MGASAGDEAGGSEETKTELDALIAEPLDEIATKKVLVVIGAVKLVQPHETRFEDLESMVILYGLYTAPVLAHIVKAIFEHLLDQAETTVPLLAKMCRTLLDHTLSVSRYQFRRILMYGFEHTIVQLLKFYGAMEDFSSNDDKNDGVNMKPGEGTIGRDPSFLARATGRQGASFFETLRREGKYVRAFFKELIRQGVIEPDDIVDMESGCPGSLHSMSTEKGWEMERKMTLCRSLLVGVRNEGKQQDLVSVASKRPGYHAPEPLRPVPLTAGETAAYEGTDKPGWEPYALTRSLSSVIGAKLDESGSIVYTTNRMADSYSEYLEHVREMNKDFVFGVGTIDVAKLKEDDTAALAVGGIPHYRVQEGTGIDQSINPQLIESTLQATYAPANIVPSASRDYLFDAMGRAGSSAAEAVEKDALARRELANTAASRLDAAGARRKLEEEKRTHAAAGEPRAAIERLVAERELDPASGLYDKLYLDTMDNKLRTERERRIRQ